MAISAIDDATGIATCDWPDKNNNFKKSERTLNINDLVCDDPQPPKTIQVLEVG